MRHKAIDYHSTLAIFGVKFHTRVSKCTILPNIYKFDLSQSGEHLGRVNETYFHHSRSLNGSDLGIALSVCFCVCVYIRLFITSTLQILISTVGCTRHVESSNLVCMLSKTSLTDCNTKNQTKPNSTCPNQTKPVNL